MDTRLLQRSLLFHGMSDGELAACCAALQAQERAFRRGERILRAGDRTDRMGLVLAGSVTIESSDVWGNCTVLSHVGVLQSFAEVYALLPGEVMLVDVRANEDCLILFLRVGSIFSPLPDAPWREKLTANLLRISTRKNLALSGRSFHTAPKSARGRLLSYLNAAALQQQSVEFDIPFDRQQLADYLNLERTSLSKEIGRMRREGIIACRKNHFRLLRPAGAFDAADQKRPF